MLKLTENICALNDNGKHLNEPEISCNGTLNIFYYLSYYIKYLLLNNKLP